MNTEPRLYVLIRKDLPLAYQAVQAGHAVAEWMLQMPQNIWRNNYLIYLSVENEEDLLNRSSINAVVFREPDLNNQATALAVLSDGKEFKKLKLWGSS